VAADENETPRAIDVVIDANSIDAAEPQRDNHLRNETGVWWRRHDKYDEG
jgi:hypothetical protein